MIPNQPSGAGLRRSHRESSVLLYRGLISSRESKWHVSLVTRPSSTQDPTVHAAQSLHASRIWPRMYPGPPRGWQLVSIEHILENTPQNFSKEKSGNIFGRQHLWNMCVSPSRLLKDRKCSHGSKWSICSKVTCKLILHIRNVLANLF